MIKTTEPTTVFRPSINMSWEKKTRFFLGIMLCLSLLGMTIYFGMKAINHGGLVDIDRAEIHSASFMVDLNSARWPEFANLPGIGPKLAKAIIAHREKTRSLCETRRIVGCHRNWPREI